MGRRSGNRHQDRKTSPPKVTSREERRLRRNPTEAHTSSSVSVARSPSRDSPETGIMFDKKDSVKATPKESPLAEETTTTTVKGTSSAENKTARKNNANGMNVGRKSENDEVVGKPKTGNPVPKREPSVTSSSLPRSADHGVWSTDISRKVVMASTENDNQDGSIDTPASVTKEGCSAEDSSVAPDKSKDATATKNKLVVESAAIENSDDDRDTVDNEKPNVPLVSSGLTAGLSPPSASDSKKIITILKSNNATNSCVSTKTNDSNGIERTKPNDMGMESKPQDPKEEKTTKVSAGGLKANFPAVSSTVVTSTEMMAKTIISRSVDNSTEAKVTTSSPAAGRTPPTFTTIVMPGPSPTAKEATAASGTVSSIPLKIPPQEGKTATRVTVAKSAATPLGTNKQHASSVQQQQAGPANATSIAAPTGPSPKRDDTDATSVPASSNLKPSPSIDPLSAPNLGKSPSSVPASFAHKIPSLPDSSTVSSSSSAHKASKPPPTSVAPASSAKDLTPSPAVPPIHTVHNPPPKAPSAAVPSISTTSSTISKTATASNSAGTVGAANDTALDAPPGMTSLRHHLRPVSAAPASMDEVAAAEEALIQQRAPLNDRYAPFVAGEDTCLTDARRRLHTAISQTRQLRAAFTERVYGKYRVCLRPPPVTNEVISNIESDPLAAFNKLKDDIASIKEEKEIEKKEAAKLNAELSVADAGPFNVDNAEQLMYISAGLNLVILPEQDMLNQPDQIKLYKDRGPTNIETGQRVKGISQAAATAGEVMLDRTRKAAAMRLERQRRRQLQLLQGEAPEEPGESSYSRLSILSKATHTDARNAATATITAAAALKHHSNAHSISITAPMREPNISASSRITFFGNASSSAATAQPKSATIAALAASSKTPNHKSSVASKTAASATIATTTTKSSRSRSQSNVPFHLQLNLNPAAEEINKPTVQSADGGSKDYITAATSALIARGVGATSTSTTAGGGSSSNKTMQQRLRHPHPESAGGRRRANMNPAKKETTQQQQSLQQFAYSQHFPQHLMHAQQQQAFMQHMQPSSAVTATAGVSSKSDSPRFLHAYLALTLPPLPAAKERLERKKLPVYPPEKAATHRAKQSVKFVLRQFCNVNEMGDKDWGESNGNQENNTASEDHDGNNTQQAKHLKKVTKIKLLHEIRNPCSNGLPSSTSAGQSALHLSQNRNTKATATQKQQQQCPTSANVGLFCSDSDGLANEAFADAPKMIDPVLTFSVLHSVGLIAQTDHDECRLDENESASDNLKKTIPMPPAFVQNAPWGEKLMGLHQQIICDDIRSRKRKRRPTTFVEDLFPPPLSDEVDSSQMDSLVQQRQRKAATAEAGLTHETKRRRTTNKNGTVVNVHQERTPKDVHKIATSSGKKVQIARDENVCTQGITSRISEGQSEERSSKKRPHSASDSNGMIGEQQQHSDATLGSVKTTKTSLEPGKDVSAVIPLKKQDNSSAALPSDKNLQQQKANDAKAYNGPEISIASAKKQRTRENDEPTAVAYTTTQEEASIEIQTIRGGGGRLSPSKHDKPSMVTSTSNNTVQGKRLTESETRLNKDRSIGELYSVDTSDPKELPSVGVESIRGGGGVLTEDNVGKETAASRVENRPAVPDDSAGSMSKADRSVPPTPTREQLKPRPSALTSPISNSVGTEKRRRRRSTSSPGPLPSYIQGSNTRSSDFYSVQGMGLGRQQPDAQGRLKSLQGGSARSTDFRGTGMGLARPHSGQAAQQIALLNSQLAAATASSNSTAGTPTYVPDNLTPPDRFHSHSSTLNALHLATQLRRMQNSGAGELADFINATGSLPPTHHHATGYADLSGLSSASSLAALGFARQTGHPNSAAAAAYAATAGMQDRAAATARAMSYAREQQAAALIQAGAAGGFSQSASYVGSAAHTAAAHHAAAASTNAAVTAAILNSSMSAAQSQAMLSPYQVASAPIAMPPLQQQQQPKPKVNKRKKRSGSEDSTMRQQKQRLRHATGASTAVGQTSAVAATAIQKAASDSQNSMAAVIEGSSNPKLSARRSNFESTHLVPKIGRQTSAPTKKTLALTTASGSTSVDRRHALSTEVKSISNDDGMKPVAVDQNARVRDVKVETGIGLQNSKSGTPAVDIASSTAAQLDCCEKKATSDQGVGKLQETATTPTTTKTVTLEDISALGSMKFFLPSKPTQLPLKEAALIRTGRFHEAVSQYLTSSLSTAEVSSQVSAALDYLLSVGTSVPIPKALVYAPLKERLNTPGFKNVGNSGGTGVPTIPRDIVVATCLVWLWAYNESIFQQAFEKAGRIDVDPDCKWLIQAAVDTAVRELSLEIAESMANGEGPFAEAFASRKVQTQLKNNSDDSKQPPQISEMDRNSASRNLEVHTASIVAKALMAELRINGEVNSIIPQFQPLVEYLDEVRVCALRAKCQERALLANLIARKTNLTETFSNAYASSLVRAGEALGHGELFGIVQNEAVLVSSLMPYDIFTDERDGAWEDPCKPPAGYTAGLAGDDLIRRAHARAMIQKSLRKLQDRHSIRGGTPTYGPYQASKKNAAISSSSEFLGRSGGQPSPRGFKRRSSSFLYEPPVLPGTGSAPAKTLTSYEPKHFSIPLDWQPASVENMPYGRHNSIGNHVRSHSLSLTNQKFPGAKKKRRSLSTASSVVSVGPPSGYSDAIKKGEALLQSTHEIEWSKIANSFHRVELPPKRSPPSKKKDSAEKHKEHSSESGNSGGTIFAPFRRRLEASDLRKLLAVKGSSSADSDDDSESSTEEDLSEEAVLARHEVVLGEMKAHLTAFLDARKQYQERRRSKHQKCK